MTPSTTSPVPALQAAKRRWAAAQQSHALRGTPSREMGETGETRNNTRRDAQAVIDRIDAQAQEFADAIPPPPVG